uniref:Uncharacterized protein n=1 Tax=Rhizophora mucronata TaxID=61149 RepID=A0A2P2NW15_RHIMU
MVQPITCLVLPTNLWFRG